MTPVVLALDNRASIAAIQRLKSRAPLAVARALNRSAATARTAITRVIAADLGSRAKDVRDRIYISQARRDKPSVTLRASAKRLGLIAFGARGPFPSRGRGKGVTANLRGRRGLYPGAFIARMDSGHVGVFQRVGEASHRGPKPHRSQLPIVELRGPSIWKVFTKHYEWALEVGRDALAKNLQHEFRYELLKA